MNNQTIDLSGDFHVSIEGIAAMIMADGNPFGVGGDELTFLRSYVDGPRWDIDLNKYRAEIRHLLRTDPSRVVQLNTGAWHVITSQEE